MKVLLFANTDWYLYNFRLALIRRLRDVGAEVILVSPAGDYGARFQRLGCRWIALPMQRRSLHPVREWRLIQTLRALYREERPDVAHHFTIKCVVYGSIAARSAGVKACINAVAGMGHVFSSDSVLTRVIRPVLKSILRIVLRGERTRLIVQNPEDRDVFVKERMIAAEYVRLIRGSGVDLEKFQPRSTPSGAARRPVQVLLATRLIWSKGVAEFVEAARLLQAWGVSVQCLVAGSPDEGNPLAVPAAYLHRCVGLGLISWLGHVEGMSKLLNEVDLVVLPTTYGEGVPRVLLEAAASGVPIVATDVAGCREVVQTGVNGVLVDPHNVTALAAAIRRLAESATEREAMGRAGRIKAVAEYDEKIVVQKTIGVYRELVGTGVAPLLWTDFSSG